jgi:hypothetical protein
MEEFNEVRRRIRPELTNEIMRLFMRDTFGFEGDPRSDSAKEEAQERVIAEEFDKTHPGLTVEKAIWSMEQQFQLWEDNVIKMGKDFFAIKTHVTREYYLDALKRMGRRIKISGELADAYILAYQEDLKNG